MDFIHNGIAHGNVATKLVRSGGDINVFRPYLGRDGRSYITQNRLQRDGTFKAIAVPVNNANATLKYDDWRVVDDVVLKAARARLRFVSDLRAGGLQYVIANGMAKTVLSTQRSSDPGSATISMDGLRKGEGDRQEYDMQNLPLPLIHSDFSFPARQLLVSANSGNPLDTAEAEASARRVAESVEQLALGTLPSFSFGGGTVYGATNFPNRITYTIVQPTATAWTPASTVTDILNMRQASQSALHFGPWIAYFSTNWDKYLDRDYSTTGGNNQMQTLRARIKAIDGIQDVRTLDYLGNFTILLVQQSSDVAREVIGLDFTTVQWPSEGGMEMNYKVMCIMVPQFRADINGNTGIVHGS